MDSTPEGTGLVNRCDEAQTYEARLAAGNLPKRQAVPAPPEASNAVPSQLVFNRSVTCYDQ